MIAGTVITPNLVAHARVLASSFARYHGGDRLVVVVTDGSFESAGPEPFDIVGTVDLGLDERELRRRASIYDAGTLAKSLKPLLLRYLLEREEVALWLDADLEIFAPLDEAVERAGSHGVVLTPHALQPRASARVDGAFNGGFVAVGRTGLPFVEWWAERLRRDCVFDHARDLHNDQGWLTYVPCYFEHDVLRDPGYNVAYWNLDQRELAAVADGFEVDGRPLRFFHFSGFDPVYPGRLSIYERSQRERPVSERLAVERLCTGYARRLLAGGYEAFAGLGTSFDVAASGRAIDRRERLLYRALLLEAERSGGPEPPDPFDPASAGAFEKLLAESPESLPLPPLERARLLVEGGPELGSPARRGPAARLVRRAALRVLHRDDDHERQVSRALLEAIEAASRDGTGTEQ